MLRLHVSIYVHYEPHYNPAQLSTATTLDNHKTLAPFTLNSDLHYNHHYLVAFLTEQ